MPPLFAIAHHNTLDRIASASQATPQSEDPAFPAPNLWDGKSWRPFRFGSAGHRGVDLDIATLVTDFEAPFVAGLPVPVGSATWGKTGAATLLRNTTVPATGAAALEVLGGGDARAWVDFEMPAGHWLTLTFAARARPLGGWRVQLQDLRTSQYLGIDEQGASAWTDKSSTALASGKQQTYITTTVSFVTRDSSVVGDSVSKLRVWLDGDGGEQPALFDDIAVWPSVSVAAVVGHNMPPLAGAFKLYAADNPAAFNTWGNQSEDDLVISMPTGGPTCFGAHGSASSPAPVHKRYWRLWLPVPPADRVPMVGMLFMGQITANLSDKPQYPISEEPALPQVSMGTLGSETQRALRADTPVRRVSLTIISSSPASAARLRRALEDAQFGARRALLIVPLANVDTALWCRFAPEATFEQQGLNNFTTTIAADEEPFPRLMP